MSIIALLVVLVPTFFYKLGQSSLANWDEAWYGEIAKQIVHSGNFWVLKFNQSVYSDHPPGGFWLIALGQQIFGINEFGTRVASTAFGLLGLLGTYLLGKELYSKLAGWCAAFVLATSPWFISRSRSGNLDIFLTTLFVWTILLAWKAAKNKIYWPFLIATFSWLLLIKTAIPVVVLPVLAVILWKNKLYKKNELVAGMAIALGIYAVWIAINMQTSPVFVRNYLGIGLPGLGRSTNIVDNLLQMKVYLHHGIGNSFRYSVAGLIACTLLARKKTFAVPVVFVALLLLPMMFSDRARIWHMIPAYPFMVLGLFGALNEIAKRLPRMGQVIVMTGLAMWATYPDGVRNWNEIVTPTPYVSDEAILARKTGEYPGRFFIYDNFIPAAAFYSNKHVEVMHETVDELYANVDSNVLLIAKKSQIENSKLTPADVVFIAEDRDKVLVRLVKFK